MIWRILFFPIWLPLWFIRRQATALVHGPGALREPNRELDADEDPCPDCDGMGWRFKPGMHEMAEYAGNAGVEDCPACDGTGAA